MVSTEPNAVSTVFVYGPTLMRTPAQRSRCSRSNRAGALLQRFRFELVPNQRIDRQFNITMVNAPRVLMRVQRLGLVYASATPVRGNVHEMVRLGAN